MNLTLATSSVSLEEADSLKKSENNTEDALKLSLFVLTSVGDIVSLFVNTFLIFVILTKQKVTRPSQKVVQSLIANLAFLSMLEMIIQYFNTTSHQTNLINVPGPLCSTVSFIRSLVHCSFLMNIVVIIYERLWSFRQGHNGQFLRTTKLIFLIWFTSGLFSVPTALMKTGESENSTATEISAEEGTSKHQSKCKSQHLFGTWEATVFYETLRFLVLHVGVGIYMLYAVMEIRSRLRYLISHSNVPQKRLERKMHSIRLIYFYLLSFIVVALPVGIIIFYRRVAVRLTNIDSKIITNIFEAFDIVLLPALMFYIYMSPLLSWLFLSGFDFPYGICSFSHNRTNQADASLIATCPLSSENGKAYPITSTKEKENLEERENTQEIETTARAIIKVPGVCELTKQETAV